MITVAKLSDWINTLEPEEMIGIDEGGLSLVVLDSRAYYEIGGMPKENNERGKPCECGSPVDACVSAEGRDVCMDRAEFIKNGKPDGMTKDAASHIKLRNRIEIVQWREIGDDEDTLSISVFAATDSSNLLDECLDANGVDSGPDEDPNYTAAAERIISDGEIMERNGREFSISITEIAS